MTEQRQVESPNVPQSQDLTPVDITKFFTVTHLDENEGYRISFENKKEQMPAGEVQMILVMGLLHLLNNGLVPNTLAHIFTTAVMQKQMLENTPPDQMHSA